MGFKSSFMNLFCEPVVVEEHASATGSSLVEGVRRFFGFFGGFFGSLVCFSIRRGSCFACLNAVFLLQAKTFLFVSPLVLMLAGSSEMVQL